jgi:hypothetical protein
LKEWLLTPDLYEFQQNLSFSTGNKGGFGLQVYDRLVKGYVYSCSGGPSSKLQLPKDESRAGLQLLQPFLVLQLYAPAGQQLSLELRVSDSANTRRKMYFSTSFSEIKTTPLHCQIPISMVSILLLGGSKT